MSLELTTFMELPEELQSEIFLRLPATSLLFCKCVCKSFFRIIDHPYFVSTHVKRIGAISYHNSQTNILLFEDTEKSYKYGFEHCLLSVDATTKDVLSCELITPPVPFIGEFWIIGSCNGLICASLHSDDDDNAVMFLLWNPVTRQTRHLPEPQESMGELSIPMYEFGFISETKDYMVVRVSGDLNYRIQVEVYKMSTNVWTTIDCSSFAFADLFNDGLYQFQTPVFLNGSFHWHSETNYIVSFNIQDEGAD